MPKQPRKHHSKRFERRAGAKERKKKKTEKKDRLRSIPLVRAAEEEQDTILWRNRKSEMQRQQTRRRRTQTQTRHTSARTRV
jgi:hypothetical protein